MSTRVWGRAVAEAFDDSDLAYDLDMPVLQRVGHSAFQVIAELVRDADTYIRGAASEVVAERRFLARGGIFDVWQPKDTTWTFGDWKRHYNGGRSWPA